MCGLKASRITGGIFTEIILIGTDTDTATVMTGNFMSNTTVARAEVGIKDSIGKTVATDGAMTTAVDAMTMAVNAMTMRMVVAATMAAGTN